MGEVKCIGKEEMNSRKIPQQSRIVAEKQEVRVVTVAFQRVILRARSWLLLIYPSTLAQLDEAETMFGNTLQEMGCPWCRLIRIEVGRLRHVVKIG
jgi:hypothetical protein